MNTEVADKPKRRRRRVRELGLQRAIFNARGKVLVEADYTGAQIVAACRQALHGEGVLCRRVGWKLGGTQEVMVVSSQFSLQHGEEVEERELSLIAAPNLWALEEALNMAWELWVRDLFMLPNVQQEFRREETSAYRADVERAFEGVERSPWRAEPPGVVLPSGPPADNDGENLTQALGKRVGVYK
jgi:hypothetical protein